MVDEMMTCCFDYAMISPTACPAAGEGDTKPFDSSVVSLGQAIVVFASRACQKVWCHTQAGQASHAFPQNWIWRARTR